MAAGAEGASASGHGGIDRGRKPALPPLACPNFEQLRTRFFGKRATFAWVDAIAFLCHVLIRGFQREPLSAGRTKLPVTVQDTLQSCDLALDLWGAFVLRQERVVTGERLVELF